MEKNRIEPIINILIEDNILSRDLVTQAEKTLADNLNAGQQALAGTQFKFDFDSYTLSAQTYPDQSVLFNLKLPQPENSQQFKTDQWEKSGSHTTLFHTETCKKVEDIEWALQGHLSWIQAKQGTFLAGDHLINANLALSHSFFYGASPQKEMGSMPIDIYISKSGKRAALADRGAGTIFWIDLEEGKILREINHRDPGNKKAFNLAVAEQAQKLYLTDNSTSILIYDLEDGSQSKLSPSAGLLGNFILTHDESTIFVLSTRPNPALKVIALESGEVLKDLSIKGDLFSVNSDPPADLIQLTPDGSQLIFMTYLNNPDPFTPVISVVDIEKRKTTARFAIKDGTRPAQLSFSGLNPLAQKNQSVFEILLDMGALSDEALRDARIKARQRALEESEQALQAEVERAQQEDMMDMDQVAFEKLTEEAEEKPKEKEEGEEEEEKFKPEKAPQKNFSPAADQLIAEHCMLMIIRETDGEIDMQSDPDLTESVGRLQAAAKRARNELEWHNGAIISLKGLVDDFNFETVIMREFAEQMLHKHERDSLAKEGLKTVPSNCPNCSKPLLGSYICAFCGYEIERPEELLRRGIISIKTIGPLDNLQAGHFLLIDIEGKRLLEIDEEKNIAWSLGKDMLHGADIDMVFPRDAVRLATKNTLITDFSIPSVVEITPSGRRFWEFDQGKSPEHRLKNPVRSTANGLNHILIVDQGNHRVIEVDKDSDIRFQYGQMGEAGVGSNQLNMPADVQRLADGNVLIADMGNHRIIELENGEIVWQYGNDDDKDSGAYGSEPGMLCYPQSAYRMENNHTLIVDTGNLRIIELNEEDEIIWEYKTNEGEEEHQLDSPFRTAYLPDGKLMILSEGAILEVNRESKEVVWSCKLSQFEKSKIMVKKQTKAKRFVRHGIKNPYARVKTAEEQEKAEMNNKVQALIAKRLSASQGRNANKAHISTYGKADLLDFTFYMVERSKNRVLQANRQGEIGWRYGEGDGQSLLKPHSCTKTQQNTLFLADTDAHRVIEIDPKTSQVIWEFGEKGKALKDDLGLNRPRFVERLDNGNVLIVDQNNRRVFELTPQKEIAWIYEGMEHLMAPYHAEKLDNGHYLISDWGAHIVFEITPEGQIVWQFGERKSAGKGNDKVSYPEHASRLKNGNTLIVDTRNHRIIEVNPNQELVWELDGSGDVKFGTPTYARRFANGHTMVLHSSNRQILEVGTDGKQLWKLMLPFDRPAPPKATPS